MRILIACAIALALCGCGSSPTATDTQLLAFFPHGEIVTTSIEGYRDNRRIDVYLPPGFERTTRSYPVLVVLDGEGAFGGRNTLRIQRCLDSLTFVGRISPTIAVGIASAAGDQRDQEYLPIFYGRGGQEFLEGVRDTVLPEMRRRYRASNDPDSTSLVGFSLGGLLAEYAGFALDETFHRVAGLSSTIWESYFLDMMRREGRGQLQRLYQDTGDFDDNAFEPLVAIENYACDSLGFNRGCEVRTVLAHGQHDIPSWAHRMPSILDYLLGPAGAACAAPVARR